MHVPHARLVSQTGQVPLDQHGARLGSLGGDDHVGPFHAAHLAGLPDLYHRFWSIDVGKECPAGHDDRVAFAHQLGTSRHVERFGHAVCTRVEEDDLSAQRGGVDGFL